MAQNVALFSFSKNPVFPLPARTARVCRQVPLASVLLSLRERKVPLAEREEYTDRARRSERTFLAFSSPQPLISIPFLFVFTPDGVVLTQRRRFTHLRQPIMRFGLPPPCVATAIHGHASCNTVEARLTAGLATQRAKHNTGARTSPPRSRVSGRHCVRPLGAGLGRILF